MDRLAERDSTVAVAELVNRLEVVAALDDAVGGIKQRDRGLSAADCWWRAAMSARSAQDRWGCLIRTVDVSEVLVSCSRSGLAVFEHRAVRVACDESGAVRGRDGSVQDFAAGVGDVTDHRLQIVDQQRSYPIAEFHHVG